MTILEPKPDFSVLTPSRNMLPHLQKCAASIQAQVETVEHWVMDAGSEDGTGEWLRNEFKGKHLIEKDRGMYDAINKGLDRASGKIVSYLNCDEQYLQGALATVKRYFQENPGVDFAFGHAFLLDSSGMPFAFRKNYPLRRMYVLTDHLYLMSCAMFFRGKIIEDGFRFSSEYRCAGDADFVLRLLEHGYRPGRIPAFTSTFSMTGKNLGDSSLALEERRVLFQSAPFWSRQMSFPLKICRRLEKLLHGAYHYDGPSNIKVFVSADEQKNYSTSKLSFRWRS